MYRPVVTVCTVCLTLINSTFCPHSVFMCFVWIWEQTAIISLYSIDWLVFITETGCVYCAVRSTFYVLPTQCIYAFCVDLRTNSDYFTVQHWLVGFYNRNGVCLLRGTRWVFICNAKLFFLRSVNVAFYRRPKGKHFMAVLTIAIHCFLSLARWIKSKTLFPSLSEPSHLHPPI